MSAYVLRQRMVVLGSWSVDVIHVVVMWYECECTVASLSLMAGKLC